VNQRFSDYRVPRFSDVPDLEVLLVDRRDVTPAGAGESPITVVAPAIGAALFRATGKRLRALPLEKGLS
jgi:isoquinoline 1-oxidoreductase